MPMPLVRAKGDGNCLYYSLSRFLYGNADKACILRTEVCKQHLCSAATFSTEVEEEEDGEEEEEEEEEEKIH